jgi:hypothetical protein
MAASGPDDAAVVVGVNYSYKTGVQLMMNNVESGLPEDIVVNSLKLLLPNLAKSLKVEASFPTLSPAMHQSTANGHASKDGDEKLPPKKRKLKLEAGAPDETKKTKTNCAPISHILYTHDTKLFEDVAKGILTRGFAPMTPVAPPPNRKHPERRRSPWGHRGA